MSGDIRQLLGKHTRQLPQPVVDVVKIAVKTVWPGANTDRGWGAQGRDVLADWERELLGDAF